MIAMGIVIMLVIAIAIVLVVVQINILKSTISSIMPTGPGRAGYGTSSLVSTKPGNLPRLALSQSSKSILETRNVPPKKS
jgi:hypothetical protein